MQIHKLGVCLFLILRTTWSAKILYMATTASPSHTIWDKTLAMALRHKHHVTFVSYEDMKNTENITTVFLEGVHDKMNNELVVEDLFSVGTKGQVDVLFYWLECNCRFVSESQGIQSFLKKIDAGERYDLIIWDITSGQCLYPIIEKLDFPPLVVSSPFGIPVYYSNVFGFSMDASYIPVWMLSYTDHMTFFQRVINLITAIYTVYVREYYYMPAERLVAEKTFGKNISSLDTFEKHISFILSNSDPVFDYPRPLPPSVIEVGGLHIKRVEKLPQDLETVMNNAKHGIILFSLGTNIQSANIPIEKRNAFIEAFAKLKQIVLWKFEADIKNLPKNVIVRKWLPQNEILAHPNVKLFISHGGALSTQEAMYHGVPVVGIPFFADQLVNMHKLTARKLGTTIVYKDMTTDDVYNNVNEVLENPVYRENMRAISKRYRDQPQNALDRALFWIEYTLRQGGGQHLTLAARDMSIIQLYYLDLIFCIFVGIIIVFYGLKTIFWRKKSASQKKGEKSKIQ